MKITQIYLDLDGVLADFDRGVERCTGIRSNELDIKQMWTALARHEDFFGTLAMMEDAQELWDYCAPYAPKILTGLPRGSWAGPQKRRWVANMLGRDVDVITCASRDKHKWSGPGHLLIDDRSSHRERWKAKGGIFILHITAHQTLDQLKELDL